MPGWKAVSVPSGQGGWPGVQDHTENEEDAQEMGGQQAQAGTLRKVSRPGLVYPDGQESGVNEQTGQLRPLDI